MILVPPYKYGNVAAMGGGDPYWSNVVLLAIHENGADTSTTFDDQSNSNHTITANGNVQWDTAQAPTGLTSSCLLDGSLDFLSIADHANFALGTSNFTVEGFVRLGATNSVRTLISKRANSSDVAWLWIGLNTGLRWFASSNGTTWNIADNKSIGTAVIDTWHHVALVRDGSTWTPYLDGTAGAGTASSTASLHVDTNSLRLGGDSNAAFILGHMAAWKITIGARYTANFTPPTLPYPTN
jgi:hypothetical protein